MVLLKTSEAPLQFLLGLAHPRFQRWVILPVGEPSWDHLQRNMVVVDIAQTFL